jgi:hypothetical protein
MLRCLAEALAPIVQRLRSGLRAQPPLRSSACDAGIAGAVDDRAGPGLTSPVAVLYALRGVTRLETVAESHTR